MKEKMVHCVTCCQALPPGMEHPKFFGQNLGTPDLTSVHELHVELEFMLDDIYALLEVLMEREMDRPVEQQQNSLQYRLYQMLQSYTGEAKQRAIRLRNAGLYWQGEVDERPDESPFPDLPPPPAVQQQAEED